MLTDRIIDIVILNIARAGGTERAVSNLVNLLAPCVSQLNLISILSNENDKIFYALDKKVRVKHMGMRDVPLDFLSKIRWYIELKKSLVSFIHADSIIIGTGHNINFVISTFGSHKKIACEHIELDTIPYLHRRIMAFFYKKIDMLVSLSETAKSKIKDYNKNVVVIPNSLPFRTEKPASLSSKRIIMVGRLDKEKGYERVVDLAMFLKKKYPSWHVDIFGNGPLKDSLLDLYRSKEVDVNVHLMGSVKDIQKEYLNSSIFLMTSYTEALPMVIIEAKSCGLPVVAYKCEGTMELVKNGFDGFLIDNNATTDLNEKVALLIENREKRTLMGQNAFHSCSKYDSEFITKEWIQALENI